MISLKDHQIVAPEKIGKQMCHFNIIGGSLVITIDYDDRAFDDLQYLQLIGLDPFDHKNDELFKGKTTTDVVKQSYQENLNDYE